MAKNLKGKTVTRENVYEVYQSGNGQWTWYVLKHYASTEKEETDHYARVFCSVVSPFVGARGELGDVYLAEIKSQATLLERNPLNPNWKPFEERV